MRSHLILYHASIKEWPNWYLNHAVNVFWGPVYMYMIPIYQDVPVYRDLDWTDNILLFSQLCLYGDWDVLPVLDPGWSYRDADQACKLFIHINAISTYTARWSEIKFKTLSDQEKFPKKKVKRSNIPLECYLCEHNWRNRQMSQWPGHPSVSIDINPGSNFISDNREISVYWDHIKRSLNQLYHIVSNEATKTNY